MPRLELCAAQPGANLPSTTKDLENDIFAWSDIKVALYWFSELSKKQNTIVANHVANSPRKYASHTLE